MVLSTWYENDKVVLLKEYFISKGQCEFVFTKYHVPK